MRRRKLIPAIAACVLLAACKAGTGAQASDPSSDVATPPVATPPVASAGPSGAAGSPTPAPVADRTIYSGGHAFPNRTLTPGATFAGVTVGQVCTSGWASAHRNVSDSLRHEVFAAYGIPYSTHARYELDHLVPLELGGNNSARNLWPEPLTDDDKIGPNKDALENHLHALVCHHQLDLGAAQRGIATNWLGMWNDYEHVAVHGSSPSRSSGGGSTGSSGSSGGSSGSGGSAGGSSDHGGATALCNDGTLSYAAHHQGACSHHGGVAVWYR